MKKIKYYRTMTKLFVSLFFLCVFTTTNAQSSLENVELKYQTCLDNGINMLGCSQKYYAEMDSLLNVLYKTLSKQLSASDFSTLKSKQRTWITKRDAYFSQINKRTSIEGLTGQDLLMLKNDRKALFVKQRVNEFYELLKKK